MELKVKYSSGKRAISINNDGSGFIYYPNGRIAACISTASEYQTTTFFYDNNKKKTLICSINEGIFLNYLYFFFQ